MVVMSFLLFLISVYVFNAVSFTITDYIQLRSVCIIKICQEINGRWLCGLSFESGTY